MVRGSDEDDGTMSGDVECTARADLAEEYAGDAPPEKQGDIVREFVGENGVEGGDFRHGCG